MLLLEIIMLRPFSEQSRTSALDGAMDMIRSYGDAGKNPMAIFSRKDWESDLIIFLYSKKDVGRQPFSPEGKHMARFFSRFGWVDHSAWEMAGGQQPTTNGPLFTED